MRTLTWERELADVMSVPRTSLAAVAHQDTIVAIGGYDGEGICKYMYYLTHTHTHTHTHTPHVHRSDRRMQRGSFQFTCLTGTKVQILTQLKLCGRVAGR